MTRRVRKRLRVWYAVRLHRPIRDFKAPEKGSRDARRMTAFRRRSTANRRPAKAQAWTWDWERA